ncbi:MAG: Lrp/AsnC family transcriptional regulator [Thaumarchaeota archaeon]|nr:Lrp/AsnC family transcriptional regulator [Nitrososphaerota archaeon]
MEQAARMSLEKSTPEGGVDEASSNVKTGQLASMIIELGPNISEIARRLGQFKESVRYRYKEKLLSKGFAVRVAVDNEKLGLRRVVLLVDFSDAYQEVAQKILRAMSEEGYLASYEKTLPDGKFLVHASVPEECVEDYREFFGDLRQKGYFRSVEFYTFHWFRNPPMKTEMYDFDEGRWDFDWSTEQKYDKSGALHAPSTKEKFDMVDLLILKELQKDANKSLAEMAAGLKINYKTLTWHFRNHIEARHLIRGYVINWIGSKYEYKLDKASNKKHTYLYVALLFPNLDRAKRMEIMAKLNILPFIWCECVGDSYEAELVFPISTLTEGLQYLSEVIAESQTQARYFIIDQTNSLTFSLIPELYDDSRQRWKFDKEKMASRIEALLLEVKEKPR